MITRDISPKIISSLKDFPVVTLTGPRQSGKTTLIKSLDLGLEYVSLEDPDIRALAEEDPKGFLSNYKKGAILDEVQNVPNLISYIQGIVDSSDAKFILSGSHNFLLLEKISQSLAGRTAIHRLLPFTMEEAEQISPFKHDFYTPVYTGFYPRIYDKGIAPEDFYPSYINTYIERDVRLIQNIENLSTFTRFLRLCAGRISQPINMRSLSADVGVSPNTIKSWLSVLEASFIVYFLQPHFSNFNKRLIKSPKLYFYDTGIACSLLGLKSKDQLSTHFLIGGLFENFIISELIKSKWNIGKRHNFYFWQDKTHKEVDLIIDKAGKLLPYEIKSGLTKSLSYFSNLNYWAKLSNTPQDQLNVIYGGLDSLKSSKGNFISWKDLDQVKGLY